MSYDRRDQIGHFVTKPTPVYRPCHHACCRGYRPRRVMYGRRPG